jgi:MerR family transcriptional regulator/heat shock protein HspR
MKSKDQLTTDPIMAIGTVADKLGISVSAIRKYEAEGLIIAHRAKSGHRLFSLEDVDRLRIIQHMIQDVGLNIEGIRRIQAFLPCWQILPCESKEKDNCPVMEDDSRPCWTIKNSVCTQASPEKCRTCIVYRFGSQCTEDIRQLVHGKNNTEDIREQIKTIMDNKDYA